MTAAFMRAMIDGDVKLASTKIGYPIPADWELTPKILEMRLVKLEKDAGLAEWQIRVMVLKASGEVVGHIGFHTAPGPAYLAKLSPGGVELGYTVFEQHRRKAYASEAIKGMMAWAYDEYEVERFVVSISPDNRPSLGLARKLGFKYLETVEDDVDGPEEVMELVFENEQ